MALTYEVGKHFYSEFLPELEELVEANLESSDPVKSKAAHDLNEKIEEVLNTDDHNWYIGKWDPVAARRKAEIERMSRRMSCRESFMILEKHNELKTTIDP